VTTLLSSLNTVWQANALSSQKPTEVKTTSSITSTRGEYHIHLIGRGFMAGRWQAKDFFVLAAIGIAGIIFESMQYSEAMTVWAENCSDALTYEELSQQCKQFSDDMDWVLIELFAIIFLTVFALVRGVMRLGGESSNRRRGRRKGMGIGKTVIIVVTLTLGLLFVYTFVMRNL
jgi:hypothetical protein